MPHLDVGALIAGLARGDTSDVFARRIAAERIGTTMYGVEMDVVERTYWGRMLRYVYEDDTKFVWDSLGNRTEYELDGDRPCWQRRIRGDVSLPDRAGDFFEGEYHLQTAGRYERGDS